MQTHKQKLLLATLSYFSTIAILLSFLYWFLKNEGFTESNFLIASIGVLLLALGWGYIIASHLLQPKASLDANLFHITTEILHELNIPLSTIKANSTLLKKQLKEDPKSIKRLLRIDSSSSRLERLYKELVYTITKEIHPIQKEIVSLPTLLQERIEALELFGRNHFIVSVTEYPLWIDRIGFEKSIDNLLMNAMKYSSKNSTIRLSLKSDTLSIVDEGVGIDETQLLKIFERYYQGDGTTKGEGIGLAVVKAYCDSEGITIQIRSKKGEGTHVLLGLEQVKPPESYQTP